nr:T6SS effector amidase Tae4 family protein [Saccharophagus degradans]
MYVKASIKYNKRILSNWFPLHSKPAANVGVSIFKDYWMRGKEEFEARSGDHIDLWNKNEITSSGIGMRSIYEFFGTVSDLNKNKEVWFWEVK